MARCQSLRRRIGYVTQSPSIYRDLTTVENVRYFAALYGIGKQRVREISRPSDFDRAEDRPRPRPLRWTAGPGVARMRAGLRPDLLILDEPTVGLDPLLRVELGNGSDMADRGKTLLVRATPWTTRQCAELILMRDGAVLRAPSPSIAANQLLRSRVAGLRGTSSDELRPSREAWS